MIRLKQYIDFVTSLTQMEEVKEGRFKVPTMMAFELNLINHRELHREILMSKKQEVNTKILADSFEIEVLGVTLVFTVEDNG